MAAKEGATVCAVGRNETALNGLKEQIGCSIIVADLTQDGQCERVVKEAIDAMSGLTSLVNCAGVLRGGSMDTASLENFMFNFNGNTKTVFEMMQHSIPHLKEVRNTFMTLISEYPPIESYFALDISIKLPFFFCLFTTLNMISNRLEKALPLLISLP